MEIFPIRIFYMTVAAFVFGCVLGVLNDANRCLRYLVFGEGGDTCGFSAYEKGKLFLRLSRLVTFFQDILFFLSAGAGIAILNYYFNNGRARIYTPVAAGVGFAVYFFTLGRLSSYVFRGILFILRGLWKFILKIFCRPICLFVAFLGNFAKKIHINVKKTIAKKQKMVYNNSKVKKAVKEARQGFVSLAKNNLGDRNDSQKVF